MELHSLNVSHQLAQLNEIFKDYKTLAQLEPGQKVEITKVTPSHSVLEISNGNRLTWSGWITQGLQRNYTKFMGYAQADANSVIDYIHERNRCCSDQINAMMGEVLNQPPPDPKQILNRVEYLSDLHERVQSFETLLKQAGKKAYALADLYRNKEYQRFIKLAAEVEDVREQLFEPAEKRLLIEVEQLRVKEMERTFVVQDERLWRELFFA